ncbi:hypothetical protein CLAIMM_00956 [Cladophialophora immunda]|nr:hypothetical protein CLAIMM_00956 [Cladophialophora immunda]
MAETGSNSQYPLLIFIVGVPGSFAHEIGQQIAYEYGFFFIGVTHRFNRPLDEQREALAHSLDHSGHNNRHARLPYLGSWQLDERVGHFLTQTQHLRHRACLVIEGYPRHTRHIPAFWKPAQRLFIHCECPKPVAERRAVGGPRDRDATAPVDRRVRDASGWNHSTAGLEYWEAKHGFDEDCRIFGRRIASLIGHFVAATSATADDDHRAPSGDGWRTVLRSVLRESFVPGKVLVLDTGGGDFDHCWARARDRLQHSLEFRTLLCEVERDFETMADEDDEDGDDDDN